ncbi:hypothetical protein S7335_3824 [Synechococcus sp. PCC 7335]|nr:hypothetical protein S7335_3824 [Synechococcus sp. PCC 7335]
MGPAETWETLFITLFVSKRAAISLSQPLKAPKETFALTAAKA